MRVFIYVFVLYQIFYSVQCLGQSAWNSKWISINQDEKLIYNPDERGNIIPDFSRVGYKEGEEPPAITATIELSPQAGDDKNRIQAAINELAVRQSDANDFKGCLLLKAGTYEVSDQLTISSSGIVIRGEGNDNNGTVIIATGRKQYSLFKIQGEGSISEISGSRVSINMPFVPVGTKKLVVDRAYSFNEGDAIVVLRPSTAQWISDLKMDQIVPRSDGKPITQWQAGSYDFHYERKVEKIVGDTLFIDNPIVMEMETKYGGGYVYKYEFEGRISNCGIEDMLLKSVYSSETDENHAWDAVKIYKAEHCWVRGVVAKHFGYSAVNVSSNSRNISVLNCKCLEAKSIITGGRRYSFNCGGQMNLFKGCFASHGRHDFVTGSRVRGPNVFTQCEAVNAHSDTGPHHRWATGTLYDLIETDGDINVQDRGNYGSGHGWAGANQVVWNCTANKICVQNPWVSAKNYAIGCKCTKSAGRHSNRPDGEWEGLNQYNLQPESLYEAQYAAWKKEESTTGIKQYSRSRNSFECYCFNHNLVIRANEANEKVIQLKVYDLWGRMVCNTNPRVKVFSTYISNLPKGIYFVCVEGLASKEVQKVTIR